MRSANSLVLAVIGLLASHLTPAQMARSNVRSAAQPDGGNPSCAVELTRDPGGLVVWSPDSKQYVVNKQDASGVYQLYVGNAGADPVCITCVQRPNGPAPNLQKFQPHWHPSGEWIELAGEMPHFAPPLFHSLYLGWMECGLGMNIYMTRPDGSQWYRLTNFVKSRPPNGFTGVAFTHDGKKGVWAQIVSGDVFKYALGKWRLILADFQETNGVPSLTNLTDITPAGATWIEPGNFAPDNKSLLITADIGLKNPQGMDQFIVDVATGSITNLTNSPNVWDEHGVFSPDGKKIFFMSSYPFRAAPRSDWAISLKTEFMMMDRDGKNLEQLTHFNYPGYPESNRPHRGSVAANGEWSPDGKQISALNLFFPKYEAWTLSFSGCSY